MSRLEIYIDGASKGNPGPAGVGVVISRGEEVLKNISEYIGTATNNIAEYRALIAALRAATDLKAVSVKIYTDSQLLYRQMKKEYRVKDPHIAVLYQQALSFMRNFEEITLEHIPRENNRGADKLATQAVKKALSAGKKGSLITG
jgi:ribonuclease HI